MMAAILSLLGSSAVGSLLGGVLALFNKRVDVDIKRLELEHEAKRWAHDLALRDKDLAFAQAEAAGRRDVAIVEGEATIEAARFAAIRAANEADSTTADELRAAGRWRWALVLASAYRKSMRSILTTVVGGAAVGVNVALAWQFVQHWPQLTSAQQMDLTTQALSWLSAQAAAIFMYWFVARGSANGPAR